MKIIFMQFAAKAGPDQPAHARRLIWAFNGIVECRRTENIQIKLHGSARSSESSLFAHGIRSIFPRCASGTFSHVAACCSRRRSMYHYFIPGKNKTARQTIHMKCQALFSSKRQNK